jgi:hypothetical protein
LRPSFLNCFCEETAVVIELSKEEQDKVVGGWGPPGAVFGGFVSAAGYLGHASTSGRFSTGDFFEAVMIGSVTGAILGPASSAARAFFAPRAAGTIGAIFGLADPRSKVMG